MQPLAFTEKAGMRFLRHPSLFPFNEFPLIPNLKSKIGRALPDAVPLPPGGFGNGLRFPFENPEDRRARAGYRGVTRAGL